MAGGKFLCATRSLSLQLTRSGDYSMPIWWHDRLWAHCLVSFQHA